MAKFYELVDKATKGCVELKSLAVNDYHEAYKMLWSQMQAGEGWAYNIFFNKLVPKRVYEPTISVNVQDTKPDGRLLAITNALGQIEELTHEEALQQVKTLSTVKIAENLSKPAENVFTKLNDEEGQKLYELLQKRGD